jgi:serine/threonine protein phosphatase PrpC
MLCISHFEDCGYYAVFDGHGGGNGSGRSLPDKHVVLYLREHLHKHLCVALTSISYDNEVEIKKAVIECFFAVDRFLYEQGGLHGSTACIVITTPKIVLYINLGDSAAIKIEGDEVVFATAHHNTVLEIERIISAGGYISRGRLNGTYLPSRAFGDYDSKMNGGVYTPTGPMSTVPDIYITERKPGTIVLGSDGLFDGFCSSTEILAIVRNEPLDLAVEKLVEHAKTRNEEDDTTCILIQLL